MCCPHLAIKPLRRWSHTINNRSAANRRSPAAKTARAVSVVEQMRAHQTKWKRPPQQSGPTKKEIHNTKEMQDLGKKNLQSYQIKQQQEGRKTLWRQREGGRERKISRQLQQMVPGDARLPTTPYLRLMIMLRPNLKPVNKPEPITKPINRPERYQQSRMHYAIRKLHLNHLNELETQIVEPTAVLNEKKTHQEIKSAPSNVPPSAQNKQEVSVIETKEELKSKNSGCALRSKQVHNEEFKPEKTSESPSPHKTQKAPVFEAAVDDHKNNKKKGEHSKLESSFKAVSKTSIEKEFETKEIVLFESLMKQANEEAQPEEELLEGTEVPQEIEEMVKRARKDALKNDATKRHETLKQEVHQEENQQDVGDLIRLVNELEQELQEMVAESKKIMETQQDRKAANESPMEKDQKAPAPILIISPSATLTTTPSKLQDASPEIVTSEPSLFKPSQKLPDYIQDSKSFSLKTPINKPTNSPTKLPRVTPIKTPVKPPDIESETASPEVKPPINKPPNKPPPDSNYNNHAGGQRVRVGTANIKSGQHRNKVKWKDAAPDQRVPGWEKHNKKKKDAAQIQRVPSQNKCEQKGP